MFKKIDAVLSRITGVVSLVSYLGFLAIMLLIVVDVVLRKLSGSGITGAYEMVERILMCGVFAGFAYTQSLQGHVHVTMLISHFPAKLRFIVFGLTGIISSFAAFALSYAAVYQASYSFSAATRTGVLGIPLYPFFWIEAVCMAAFGIALLWDAFKSFAAVGNKELAAQIQSNWT